MPPDQRVTLPAPVDNLRYLPPVWDWYAATVEAGPDEILADLLAQHDLADIRPGPGLHGYQRGALVGRGSNVFARLLWGGNGDGTHIWATGAHAPGMAAYARASHLGHRVTRYDSAIDFRGAPWPTVEAVCLHVADAHRVGVTHVGDFHRGESGRTLYLGAPTSVVRVRLYEKGIKEGGDPLWIRAEVQVRPKRNREAAGELSTVGAWGASRWSADLLSELTGLTVDRYRCGTLRRPSDAERAVSFMQRQYGERLRQRADEIGLDALLKQLADTIKDNYDEK